jgi:hypothetical protein
VPLTTKSAIDASLNGDRVIIDFPAVWATISAGGAAARISFFFLRGATGTPRRGTHAAQSGPLLFGRDGEFCSAAIANGTTVAAGGVSASAASIPQRRTLRTISLALRLLGSSHPA